MTKKTRIKRTIKTKRTKVLDAKWLALVPISNFETSSVGFEKL